MTHTISVPATDPMWIAERLPQPAAMKYETAIVEPHVAARALYDSASNTRQDEQDRFHAAQHHLARLQEHNKHGGVGKRTERYLAPFEMGGAQMVGTEITYERSEIVIDAAVATVTKAKERLDRAKGIMAARAEIMQQLGQLQLHIEEWFRGVPAGAELRMHAPAIAPANGATLETVRARIENSKVEHETTQAAALPKAEQRAAVGAYITSLAERGKPSIGRLDQGRPEISFAFTQAPVSTSGNTAKGETLLAMGTAVMPDVKAMIAWLFKDELIAALEREFDLNAKDDRGMTEADRKANLADLEVEILATERAEEVLIERSIAQGQTVVRRPDADPRAVLGLADHPAPRREVAA